MPDQIYKAILAVKGEVGSIGKDTRNPQQGYMYRGVDAVVERLAPLFNKHDVIVTPRTVRDVTHGVVEVGKNRTPMSHVTLVVEYRFTAVDGSYMTAEAPGEAMDSGDKATPKAMSVAYRTVLLQALSIPTGDGDPDADSYERSEYQEPIKPSWDPLKDAKNKAWQAAQAAGLDVDAMLAELRVWTGNPKLEAADVTEVEMWAGFTAHLQSIDPTVEKPDKFDEAGFGTPEGAQT